MVALLTVITVVKDDEAGLNRTLESLAEQEPADWDLLVVDGSRDRQRVPAELASRRGIVSDYAWIPPLGVYPAMNAGLQRASSDYVYFLNAGDVLVAPDVLSTVVARLAAVRPTWAFGRVRFLREDGVPMSEPAWDYAVELRHGFARGRFPAHQGVVVSTNELRRQGGFDESYRVAADYASILRCAVQATPLELDLTLAEFRAGGLSSQQWRLAQSEFHRARRSILRPTGLASVREHVRTWRTTAATAAYRTLWAPGRPASPIARRAREGVPGMRGQA